ncbi:MAG: TIGR03619 family F420-dependent LLM class oxidoreductase [Kutzneria sp.]|nr:TIGR03619 family F420-dependent LLM class oxidoreductase [Kutzneria sp.]
MRLEVVLPNESAAVAPERIAELAVSAERLGYDTVWLPDHVLPPEPYGPERYGGVYEPLTMLSYVAARTTRIRLGTSVLAMPMRNPFVVAKQVATLSRLAPGRVVLGVGIGWDAVEFASVGADFAGRAAYTEGAITLLRHLFTTGSGPFSGERFGFHRGVFEPVPADQVPIMVGGVSDAALRRAARLADEWQAVGLTAANFAERVSRLRAYGGQGVIVGSRIEWADEHRDRTAEVASWQAAGADRLAVWFGAFEGFEHRMSAFARRPPDRHPGPVP